MPNTKPSADFAFSIKSFITSSENTHLPFPAQPPQSMQSCMGLLPSCAISVSIFSALRVFAISERLDKGLIDFGIFIEPFDLSKYDYLRLPLTDTWGILMRKDSPLAKKQFIAPEDLWDKPLILSRQSIGKNLISEWFHKSTEELNVVATGNLLYNMSLLVEEGLGYAVCLDKIINTTGDSDLCFRPFYPELKSHLDIAWKKYQVFPKCTEIFLKRLQEIL